jgi:hypothetical protein
MSDDDHGAPHADCVERVEHPREDRPPADREERLLRVVRQGRQPAGYTGGQDDRGHLVLDP